MSEQTHGYLNRAAKSRKELPLGQYQVLQKLTKTVWRDRLALIAENKDKKVSEELIQPISLQR